MKFMRRSAGFLLLAATVSLAYADGSGGERSLVKVRVVDGDIITIDTSLDWTTPTFLNPDNCDNTSFAVIRQSDPGSDKKLTLALSAYMAGKKVGTWFTGCVGTPWGFTAPLVYTIYVVD